MADRINKSFLENVRLSDLPVAWALEAHGYHYSAQAMSRGNTIANSRRHISTQEAHLYRACYKNSCYLLAHSIELSLKAIYCRNDGDDVEKFSHNILRLKNDLIARKVLNAHDFDEDAMQIAYVLLDWQGRYHRPRNGKIREKIKELYVESPENPELLEKKFPVNSELFGKLSTISNMLIQKLNISPASLAPLIFDPF